MKQLSLRAMQVLAAIAVKSYCTRCSVRDPAIDSFLKHLWDLASARHLPAWEIAGRSLEITGRGDRLPARITERLAPEQEARLSSICEYAYEISQSQMYSAYRPDTAFHYLGEVFRWSGFTPSPPTEEIFAEHAAGSDGWGEPVCQILIERWKIVAQPGASPNGGPAAPSGDPGATEGPPSVS